MLKELNIGPIVFSLTVGIFIGLLVSYFVCGHKSQITKEQIALCYAVADHYKGYGTHVILNKNEPTCIFVNQVGTLFFIPFKDWNNISEWILKRD
jgi:hypothetical protein